jgi:hypothetical protein
MRTMMSLIVLITSLALVTLLNNMSAYADSAPVSHWTFDQNRSDSGSSTIPDLEISIPNRMCTDTIKDYCWNSSLQIGNENYVDGVISKAHRFDGFTWFSTPQSHEYVYDFDVDTPKSFSFWYRADEWTGHMYILTKKGDHDGGHKLGYSVGITTNGTIWYEERSETQTLYTRTKSDSSSKDYWTHVVITNKGTGLVSDVLFYINGTVVEKDSPTLAPTVNQISTSILNDEPLVIGSFRGWHGWNFIGDLDDVRVYDYELTPAQILQLYEDVQDNKIESPLKQLKSGIQPANIVCQNDFVLIHKSNSSTVACVTSTTADRLIKIGWGNPVSS